MDTFVQRLPRTRPKVHLSKDARALLTIQRRQKSRVFRATLDDAWFQIDESVKTIASSHHKSVRRVQNDLYLGHAALRYKMLKSETVRTLGMFLFEEILCRWGVVEEIVTDNGSPFVPAVSWLAEKYHIHHIRILAYNSQANGIVE
jgi:hypothetical protein